MNPFMAALLVVLVLFQDPAVDEIRTLLRRLETPAGSPAETAQLIERLGEALERVEPDEARAILGEAIQGVRMPAARRLDVAESLFGLDDRATWTAEAGRIALDPSETPETRMRAALLLARAGSPRAGGVGRTLDERLFAEGTDAAALALGTHLREGTSRDLQRLEVDFLFRLPVPGARAALREALVDDALDPVIRLEIAERLHAAGGIDRVRDVRAALDRIRALDPAVAGRVDRLLASLRGLREEPASGIATEPPPAVPKRRSRNDDRRSPGRVNLIIAGSTLALLALLIGWKRRA